MIPIARPLLGQKEADAAREAVLSGWVTQGPRVAAFESAFGAAVGAPYACALSNCTAALHLALLGAGVGPGDVVVSVSHSFIATANAIRYCGAEPVFVDVDPVTYGMDPKELARFLAVDCDVRQGQLFYRQVEKIARGESPLRRFLSAAGSPREIGRVAAVLPVHQMGIPCDIAEICTTAESYRLPVVEDAACAVGSEVSFDRGGSWERIGRPRGIAACFSFHPRKVVTTGDGGMITTRQGRMDDGARLLRQHGMSVSDTARHRSREVVFESYATTGYNYRLTDIQAAVGIVQLERLDPILAERRRLAEAYRRRLAGVHWLALPEPGPWVRPNWQSFPVRLARGAPLGQRALMQTLLERGIATRRGIMNIHQEPAYRKAEWALPRSEDLRDRTLLLPFYPGLGEDELESVCRALEDILS